MTPARKQLPLALALALVFLIATLCLTGHATAATITIVNVDGAGEGFNDPTVVAPVGGNPGTTVGAQRLHIFQTAAAIWGRMLPSAIEIRVQAQFNPLTPCNASSGVLGSAGPLFVEANFPGAIFANTWYHEALANKLSASDLTPGGNDIGANFNSSVGSPTCLTPGWYYGIDGNEGGQIELLPVVLHELGHGLGFSTTTNGQTGAFLNGPPALPHVYDRFLYGESSGLHWYQMSAPQRITSAASCTGLTWDGPLVTSRAPIYLSDKPLLHVNAPAPVVGDYEVGVASFGPPLTAGGLTGDVMLANDGVGVVTNGCEPLVGVYAGKVVLMDRGTCGFTIKVKNAQNAGAIGAIVADSAAGCPPAGMAGVDPTITIPSVRITLADGTFLKANLLGLNGTMLVDPTKSAGTHLSGRVMLYAPNPFQGGSSVSHFDTSTEPNLLMEPAINNSLSNDPDMTIQAFADMGWYGATPVDVPGSSSPFQLALSQNAPNPGSGAMTVHYSIPTRGQVVLRLFDVNGRLVSTPVNTTMDAGPHVTQIRTAGLAAGVYFYRLESAGKSLSRRLVVLQ